MIFVNHCHLFPVDHLNESDPMVSYFRKGGGEDLLSLMERHAIDRAVTFSPYRHQVSGIENPVLWMLDEIADRNDLVGFAAVESQYDSPELLRHYGERGIAGLKLHPAICRVKIDDPAIDWIYDAAESQHLPVVIHTGEHGWESEKYTPSLIGNVAGRYPRLRIVIEHCGGEAHFCQTLSVLRQHKNCYAGITSVVSPSSLWFLTDARLVQLVREIGSHRIIYGSEFPWREDDVVAEEMAIIRSLKIAEEEKADILGNALNHLLNVGNEGQEKPL